MKYIIAFASFHLWKDHPNEVPWYSQFDESIDQDNNIEELLNILNTFQVCWTYQLLTVLYLRIMIKEQMIDRNQVELRVYHTKDRYEVVGIDFEGKLNSLPIQFNTHNDLYLRLL